MTGGKRERNLAASLGGRGRRQRTRDVVTEMRGGWICYREGESICASGFVATREGGFERGEGERNLVESMRRWGRRRRRFVHQRCTVPFVFYLSTLLLKYLCSCFPYALVTSARIVLDLPRTTRPRLGPARI